MEREAVGFANKIRISKFHKKCCNQTRIQSFFGVICLLVPINYYLSRERNFLFKGFRVRPKKFSKYASGEQQTFGENRVSIGNVAIVLDSRA